MSKKLDQINSINDLVSINNTDDVYANILKNISADDIISPMKQDKKRIGNKLPLIMMDESYTFIKILDLIEEEAMSAIEYFKNTYCK
jgi:3-dehydroquinate synthetase